MSADLSSKKVLITGINGFTGVHLERYLKRQGFEVHGSVIDAPKCSKHHQCDITDASQIDALIASVMPDYVIHTAAISFVGESDVSLIYNVNVIGSENLLQALLNNGCRPQKVILASSATVYGNQGKELLDESMCPKPVNHYGCSKLAMEHLAANYFDKLDIIITRPFNYTGIGQAPHFLIPKIVSHFKEKKRVIELGNIHVAREFNDVRFVSDVYHGLMCSEARSIIVNIATNRPVKLLDVIETMQRIAGYKIEVRVNPAFVRPNEISSLAGSTDRLSSLVDIKNNWTLEETLRWMYEA